MLTICFLLFDVDYYNLNTALEFNKYVNFKAVLAAEEVSMSVLPYVGLGSLRDGSVKISGEVQGRFNED